MPILGTSASQNTKSFLVPNIFVALGKALPSYTSTLTKGSSSTDGGITWTDRTLPSIAGGWISVIYGGGTFVAIPYYGTIAASSTDGITWMQRTIPNSSFDQDSSAYGNGVFVALSSYPTIAASSTDGITWTQRTLPVGGEWRGVAYGNGVFAAVSRYSANAATSTNGITWTQRTLPSSSSWMTVAYGNNKFVALARQNSDVLTSTDGTTWTQYTTPFGVTQNREILVYGNGVFLAFSKRYDTTPPYAGYDAHAETSTDGITWTYSTLPAFMLDIPPDPVYGDGTSGSSYRAVTYGDGKFLAITSYHSYGSPGSAGAASSTNGITWTQRTLSSVARWQTVGHSTEPIG